MGIGIVDLLLIAVALSMDAFAVAVSSGIVSDSPGWKNIVKLGFFFGFFQFLMPVIGWLLGSSVSTYIESIDHWVAFGLLAFIGIRMIIEAAKGGDEEKKVSDPFGTKNLFVMAIATSIDALAVGISFALTGVSIWSSSAIIGVVTFTISSVGVLIGKKVGSIFEKSAGILAGIILVGIGVKILIEHMM
jgi:manganese efflux pump family protein